MTGTSGGRVGGLPASIRVPSGFGWTIPFTVRQDENGHFTTSLSPSALRVSTTRSLYVDVATGNDGNAGTNPLLPKKSIWSAINLWQNDTIYVKSGFYYVANSWSGGVPFGANQNIIAVEDFTTLKPGRAISSVAVGGLTWSHTGGNVWEAALAAKPYGVISSAAGDYGVVYDGTAWLVENVGVVDPVSDMAPMEWWHNAGVLYVYTTDGLTPAGSPDRYRALKDAVNNGWLNTALNLCVDGITFEGGGNNRAFFLQDCGTVSFVDCTFRASEANGCELNVGVGVVGTTHTVYLIRCHALDNHGDGFGATVLGANETVRWLEQDCVGNYNWGSVISDQNASLHFTAGNTAVTGVRVGGIYTFAKSQQIADVGGTKVWNLGVIVFTQSGAPPAYFLGDTGTAWFHGCVLDSQTSSSYDIETDNAGGTVNHTATNYQTTTGPGTIQGYTP
jgi:hypothetical protein